MLTNQQVVDRLESLYHERPFRHGLSCRPVRTQDEFISHQLQVSTEAIVKSHLYLSLDRSFCPGIFELVCV